MKKILLLFALAGFFSNQIYTQEIVLEKDVEKQYKEENGPNTRHFSHIYIGGGGILDFDEENGAAINGWRSGQFLTGYRYKLKVLPFWALGLDLSFKMDQYFMEGDKLNPFDSLNPLTFKTGEKRHKFTNNGLGLELYTRINFDKRGNSLGNFLDLGVHGQWNVADVEEIITNYDNATYVGRDRIFNRRLKFVEEFSYGLSARIGLNKFAIHSYYRLSDLFKEDFAIPELPRLTIGLQYAIY